MALFSPEAIIRALGIDPAMLAQIGQTFATMQSNVDAMRDGFVRTIEHFNNRLDTIEERQRHIDMMLRRLLAMHGGTAAALPALPQPEQDTGS